MEMEYSSSNSSSLSAFGVRNPNHDPPLAHHSQPQPESAAARSSHKHTGRRRRSSSPHHCISSVIIDSLVLSVIILDQSITIRDDEDEQELPGDDPIIQGINDQQTSRGFYDPNVAPYALTIVLTLAVPVSLKLKHGKHNHLSIANPFVPFIVVGSAIAYLAFSIRSWINDRSNYKMLKGIYYIACNVAFISLLISSFATN